MVKFPRKFDDLIPPAALGKLLEVLNQPALSNTVREALQKVGLKEGNPIDQVQNAWQQARGWLESVSQRVVDFANLNPTIINATGQLIQSQWTNLPMHPSVAQSIAAASVSFQDQSRLFEHARQVAINMTAADDAAFACSLPAAIESLGQLPDFSGGLVVSRTDAIRVPGFADVRELLASNNRNLIEIGAVNGTSHSDWTSSLRSSRQAAVMVSPNCLESAEAKSQRAQAIAAARQSQSPVVEILFDATANQELASALGLPSIQQSLSSGADLVLAPLDWFMGGPSGAIAIGKSTVVAALRKLFDARGLAMHGAALAGVSTIMTRHDAAEKDSAGVARLMLASTANLSDRARRIIAQVEGTARVRSAVPIERVCRLGPAPWNRYSIPSVAIAIEPTSSVSAMCNDLENSADGPAILAAEEAGKILLNLRLVDPSQDHFLVQGLTGNQPSQQLSSPM